MATIEAVSSAGTGNATISAVKQLGRKFLIVRKPSNLDFFPNRAYTFLNSYLDNLLVTENGRQYQITRRDGASDRKIALTRQTYDFLREEGTIMSKVRYAVPCPDNTVYVDVYGGELEGLIVAKIKFGSKESAEEFTPPSWFGMEAREITEDARYSSRGIAVNGRSLLRMQIEEFGPVTTKSYRLRE